MEVNSIKSQLREHAHALGFSGLAFTKAPSSNARLGLFAWLEAGFHGEMAYMARNTALRCDPQALFPGTQTVISARMRYWPSEAFPATALLKEQERAYIARYALGRDYHKVFRSRLKALAHCLADLCPHAGRVFCDSAPIMEVDLATSGGLGWRGKHTLLLDRDEGSWFFLGELLTSLDLPADPPKAQGHCGRCEACLQACPTGAIVAPYRLDARRCLSYLTIEHPGTFPEALRPLMGNRIYGCDDCQLVCPWNRRAPWTKEPDFAVRHGLDRAPLVALFAWEEADFRERMAGSAIYRIGYIRWLRNIAIALGNAPFTPEIGAALAARQHHENPLVREHVAWAQAQQTLAQHAPLAG
jgi:epoxyqueuosine reductase